MRRLYLLLILVCMLGCTAPKYYTLSTPTGLYIGLCDPYWGHEGIWASGEHFWFSAFSYKHPAISDVHMSRTEKWWGCPVFYTGARK
jgi:hypothetical protein